MADVSVEFGAQDVGLEKTLKTIQAEMTDLQGKVKGGELSFDELERTMRKIGQAEGLEKKLKAIGDQSSGTSTQVDELGKDMKLMGDKSEDAGKRGELSFGKIAGAAALGGAAVKAGMLLMDGAVAAAQKTIQSFGDAIDLGGRLVDLKERTGVAADQLLVLERAFNNAGLGADSLGPLLNKMQKAIVDAGDGTSTAADAFVKLGIPLSQLKNLTPDEQFKLLGKAIADIDDPAQRAAVSMEVFGKSGGALNQLFANLDGEIQTASAQLGILPGIMAKLSEKFDNVGDNIAAIQNKFTEFAAGILSRVMPALEAVTTSLSRIDAASIGQSLADAFVGAGQAMKGFDTALKAINAGQIGLAFQSVWASVVLQTKETANEIYKNLSAAVSTSVDFFTKILGPDSAAFMLLERGFQILSAKIKEQISGALFESLSGMGPAFAGLAENAKYSMEYASRAVEQYTTGLGANIELVKEQLVEAGAALPDTFKEKYAEAKPLLNVAEDLKRVDELTKQVEASTQGVVAQESEAEKEAKKYFQEYQKGLALKEKDAAAAEEKLKKERQANDLKQEELAFELQLAEAKASGNKQEIEDLNKKKEWLDAWKKAIASGMGEEQAAAFANNLAAAKINADNLKPPAFTTAKEDAQAMENALGGSKSFLEAMGKIEKVKAVEEAKLDAKAARAEIEAFGEYMNVDLQNMSFADIAKKLGVRDLSLTGKEQVQAIIDFVGESKDKLAVNPIDSDAFNSTWQGIQDTITGKKTILPLEANTTTAEKQVASLANPKTVAVDADTTKAQEQLAGLGGGVAVDLDAEQSIESIRQQLKDGIELDIAAKSGTSGLLEQIKGFVEQIKTAVEKIEPKLPTSALAA
jgi:hypothetical protein